MTATPAMAVLGPDPVGGRQPAVDEAMRQQAAALLQHAYRWLETAIPVAPQLAGTVPPLVTAVQRAQARNSAASLNRASAVISALQQARWAFPTLPPL